MPEFGGSGKDQVASNVGINVTSGQHGSTREREDVDLVGQYLGQIGATPLLTAAEEVELSKRIEAGLYAAELLRTADAEGTEPDQPRKELQALVRDGELARDHMIRANLRLVVSVARRYYRHAGLSFLDVIQDGNLGLIRAVEKFDYAKGFKFSTYATWWIRQAIERGRADRSRTVRLPVHVVEKLNRLNRIERNLATELGRDPTNEEVAAEAEMSVEQIEELHELTRSAVSLDTPIGEDGETRIGDLIEDIDVLQPAEVAEHRELTDGLRSLVASLPPRQATIISLRFGLDDGKPHTLAEVAERVGLTRERVRQLEKHALAELRNPKRHANLLPWAS
jgi:RNA polymerase primary sigma factor/RNA polymerase nonessential primary-like sigma factor